MVELLMKSLPVSGLFLAIVFFSGLIFKLTTQNARHKQRSMKFVANQFYLCIVAVIFTLPVITLVSASKDLAVNSLILAIPIVVAALAMLGIWRAFEAIMRHYPKDAPKQVQEPVPQPEELS